MDATTIATALAGLLAPVITLIVSKLVDPEQKTILALGIAVFLAVVALAVTGGFTSPQTIATTVIAVVGISQTLYALIIKQVTDITPTAPMTPGVPE